MSKTKTKKEAFEDRLGAVLGPFRVDLRTHLGVWAACDLVWPNWVQEFTIGRFLCDLAKGEVVRDQNLVRSTRGAFFDDDGFGEHIRHRSKTIVFETCCDVSYR